MNKRAWGVSAFLALSVFLHACAPNQSLRDHLIANSIDLTCTMDSLAQSTEYIALSSGTPEMTGFIAEIGADEYTSPSKAILITVPDATADAAIKNAIGEPHVSDSAYEMIVARMLSAVPSRINAQQGVMAIAATSILAADTMFPQHKDFTATTYVILLYDNRSSVTLFRNAAKSITSAAATFLFPNGELAKAMREETVFDYFSEMFGVREFEVEYVAEDAIKRAEQ